MLIVVSGGSASGKSEYAEGLVLQSQASCRVYVATMEVWDQEGRDRVERHRRMRRDKGFFTVEAPYDLAHADIPADSVTLLECLSNLCANECFGSGGQGMEGAYERIRQGVRHLVDTSRDVVIVTNELFSDGVTYPPETEQYLDILARLNREIAAEADQVWEVCCGIPVCWKGAAV